MKYSLCIAIICVFLSGCAKDSGLKSYDIGESYIYFAQPDPDRRTQIKNDYIDSLYYSFALDGNDLTVKTIAIPVVTIGQRSNSDRFFSVTINSKMTTLDHRLISIREPVIRANAFQDSLYITIKRDSSLRDNIFIVQLELQDNTEFKRGLFKNTIFRIMVTDQIAKPAWWDDWIDYFGPYRREVYLKWMEVYYPGLDRSPPSFFDKPGYAWNNMPSFVIESNNPVTFFYIRKMKQYFIDNAVYPDDDHTKPRIYLP